MSAVRKSFEEIAAGLYNAPAAGSNTSERRTHGRTPAKGDIRAALHRTGAIPLTAIVRDLSRGGIGLSSGASLRRGEDFDLIVNLGAGRMRIICRCRSCRLGKDNRYIIGAQFLKIERVAQTGAAEPSDHRSVTAPRVATSPQSPACPEPPPQAPAEINAIFNTADIEPLDEPGKFHVNEVEERLKSLQDNL